MPGLEVRDCELLGRLDLFGGLDKDAFTDFVALGTAVVVPAQRTIFEAGDQPDRIYIILQGEVAILSAAGGDRTLLLNQLGAGEILGEIAAIDGGPRTAGAVAVTRVRLAAWRRDPMRQFMRAHPVLLEGLLLRLATRVRHMTDNGQALIASSARQRIARVLLAGALEGIVTPAGRRLRTPLQQNTLAMRVGLSRETTNKILRRLVGLGIISNSTGSITVRDLTQLQRMAGDDAA